MTISVTNSVTASVSNTVVIVVVGGAVVGGVSAKLMGISHHVARLDEVSIN